MVLLASTRSTSFVSLTVNNLNNYKCVVVAACAGSDKRIIVTTIVPVDYFKSSNSTFTIDAVFAGSPSTYETQAYYLNDTQVYLKSKNSTYCIAALFGIT